MADPAICHLCGAAQSVLNDGGWTLEMSGTPCRWRCHDCDPASLRQQLAAAQAETREAREALAEMTGQRDRTCACIRQWQQLPTGIMAERDAIAAELRAERGKAWQAWGAWECWKRHATIFVNERSALEDELRAERGRTWEAWRRWADEAAAHDYTWAREGRRVAERDAARADLERLAGAVRAIPRCTGSECAQVATHGEYGSRPTLCAGCSDGLARMRRCPLSWVDALLAALPAPPPTGRALQAEVDAWLASDDDPPSAPAEPTAPSLAVSCGDCGTMLHQPGEKHRCLLPVPTMALERLAAFEARAIASSVDACATCGERTEWGQCPRCNEGR